MERLRVKNFGPLRDVDIELKNINIFIGTTSSGKSTIAKLISIFKGGVLDGKSPDALQTFSKLLANYNIDFQIYPDTLISYENDDLFYEIEGTEFRSNISKNNIRSLNPIY